MSSITVTTHLPVPPETVWEDVEDLGSHVEWMADAEAITFRDDRTSGVGTVMDVLTAIGPLRTTDVIEITEWEPPSRMGVRHKGAVAGTGAFTIEPDGAGGSIFTWTETLHFPWFFGGPIGAWFARPIFRWIWTRNLDRLAARF
jgi:carbon monoxide dehydrogenase subunit G